MAKFKIILSDPETGKCQTVELEGSRAIPLIGRKIGETVDGAVVGLGGTKTVVTGGSDKDGFPMRPDIHGGVKTRVIMTQGVGFHSDHKGERRRKTVRGSIITEDIVQVNMKITKKPKKPEKAEKAEKSEKVKQPEKAGAKEKIKEKAKKPEKKEIEQEEKSACPSENQA